MIRRFSIGYDVELHKRTLSAACVSLIGPAGGGGRRRRTAGRRARPTPCPSRPASPVRASAPTSASICSATPQDTAALSPALPRRRPRRVGGRGRDACAWSTAGPATASISTTGHPPGGRPQRSRGLVHQGLLRRPGDGRAALLPRQAEPDVARPTAHRRAAPGDAILLGDREVGRLGSVASSPEHGQIALALVRREAPSGSRVAVRADEIQAVVVVEPPFSTA